MAATSPTTPQSSGTARLHTAVRLSATLAGLVIVVPFVTGWPVVARMPDLWRLAIGFTLFFAGDTALFHIRFGHNQHSFTWSETAVVVGLAVVPCPWLRVMAFAGVGLAHLLRRRAAAKVVFNASIAAFGVFLARLAATAVAGRSTDYSSARTLGGLAAGAGIFWLCNSLSVPAVVAFSQRLRFIDVYRKGIALSTLVAVGNIASGVLLIALAQMNPWALTAVPGLGAVLFLGYRGYLRAMDENDRWAVLQAASRELLQVDQLELARVVVERSRVLFNAEFVELLVVDNEPGTTLHGYRRSDTNDLETISGPPFQVAAPFWGRVLSDREPFEMFANKGPTGARTEMRRLDLGSCAVAPLLTEAGCIGMLRIGFHGEVHLGGRELQVFGTFANHVSAAVSNAKMFEEVRTSALRDPLTGLPNRSLLIDRLDQALGRAKRLRGNVAVLFLDLDRFKVINDSLGHEAGDELLVVVAHRLQAQLRPGDTVVRFGGDEFVVICEDVDGQGEAMSLANRIAEALRAPFRIRGKDTYCTVSVGVVLADGETTADPVSLLRDADAAMYRAKEHGRARCEIFDDTIRMALDIRLERENELRGALGQGQLLVYYQPTVDIAEQRITGAEALVRWHHPTLGMIPPNDFIPLAEESDLIVALGEEVLRQAIKDAAELPGMTIAVNLAARQLAQADLADKVAAILAEHGVNPSRLCLEITESVVVSDTAGAMVRLQQLRNLGVKIALDDFGTGYSSLSHLRDLPVDIVKIDRSFVANVLTEDKERAIIRSVVDVAHALGLSVVAEGVETAGQLAAISELGCDTAQGYYFAKAGPRRELEDHLRTASLLA